MKQLVIILAMMLGFAACREGQKTPATAKGTTNGAEMLLTAKDTAAVETLTKMFMDRAKRGRLDSAAMLLRTYELHRQPQGLDSAGFREVMATLGQFPVADYEIKAIVFHRPEDNEVKCRVRIANGTYTNWYFKPVRYIGRWSLCLKDAGDKPLK